MRIVNKNFTDQTIPLDGNHFVGCTFDRCKLVFTGQGDPPMIEMCTTINVQWLLDGAAGATLVFLAKLESASKGLVQGMLDHVQKQFPEAMITLN